MSYISYIIEYPPPSHVVGGVYIFLLYYTLLPGTHMFDRTSFSSFTRKECTVGPIALIKIMTQVNLNELHSIA